MCRRFMSSTIVLTACILAERLVLCHGYHFRTSQLHTLLLTLPWINLHPPPISFFLFPFYWFLIFSLFLFFSISFANDLFFSLRPTGLSLCKKPFAVKPRDSEIGIRLTQMRSVMKNFFTARIYLNLRKHPNARRMCTVAIGTKLEAHFYIQFAPKSDTLTMTLFISNL